MFKCWSLEDRSLSITGGRDSGLQRKLFEKVESVCRESRE